MKKARLQDKQLIAIVSMLLLFGAFIPGCDSKPDKFTVLVEVEDEEVLWLYWDNKKLAGDLMLRMTNYIFLKKRGNLLEEYPAENKFGKPMDVTIGVGQNTEGCIKVTSRIGDESETATICEFRDAVDISINGMIQRKF